MAVQRIILNETSYFGAGARTVLADEAKMKGFTSAFVVTDKDLVKFGICKMVTDVLEKAGMPFTVYDDVKANPTMKNVKERVQSFRR